MTRQALIVHATVEHGDSRWGGIAAAVELAAAGTAAMGIDTLVVCPGTHDRAFDAPGGYQIRTVAQGDGDPVEIYGAPNRVAAGRRASKALFAAIARERGGRPVRLLVHGEELALLLALAAEVAWCQERMAFSHGLASQEHPGRPELARQQRRFFIDADRVFVASEPQRSIAEAQFPGVNFQCLPLPLSLLSDQLSGFRRSVIERHPGRLVAAGRAVRQKGIDILLHALSLLPTNVEADVRIFLGHGDRAVEKECAALAKEVGVHTAVMTWRSRADLLREMAKATAVVVPSRFEPLGLVAAEALALGTPVVAADVGGLADLVGELPGTMLIAADDVRGPRTHDLSVALGRVLSTPPWEVDSAAHLGAYSPARFRTAFEAAGVK
jgi:glycosyltransferase involved in cell wall biosynthesis